MAATATARIAPTGLRLRDGMFSKITFSVYPSINLWEISTKPPGLDGGESINTTTMFNSTYRTMAARALKTLTAGSAKCAFDPAVHTQLLDLINQPCTITQRYNDGSTLAYFGYLQKWEPDEMVEGTMPTGTATIVPTNEDPVTHLESAPVITSVAGT